MLEVICIEGLDGVGKASVTRAVNEILRTAGYSTFQIDFPRYSTPTGKVIRNILDGEYGHTPTLPPDLIGPSWTLDRIGWFRNNLDFLIPGYDYLILDRSYFSNFMYQGAKVFYRSGRGARNFSALTEWLINNYRWEFELTGLDNFNKIKLSTIVLTLDEESRKRQMQNRTEKDLNEKTEDYQKMVESFLYDMQTEDSKLHVRWGLNVNRTLSDEFKDNIIKHYFDHVNIYPISSAKIVENAIPGSNEEMHNKNLIKNSIMMNAAGLVLKHINSSTCLNEGLKW